MRGSSGGLVKQVLEGSFEGKKGRGRPSGVRSNDIEEWFKCRTIGMAKRVSENSISWQDMVHYLRLQRSNIV